MEPDTMILKKRQLENISNLLVKHKEGFSPVQEDYQTTKLKLISIHSQNSKPNLEMEQVPSNKPENITELLVLVKPTSVSQ
jgi:hypothetical protein